MNYSHCLFADATTEPQATIAATDTIKAASGLYAFRIGGEHQRYYIGVDEAGRGPLISRVYTGAVILPDPGTSMDLSQIRDSKKLTAKKIHELADYIKQHAIAWAVAWEDERTIDEINILEATQRAMHKAIKEVIEKINNGNGETNNIHLVVDGNRFNVMKNPITGATFPYTTVEGGDNIYSNIAAASILAKSAHDNFIINELCKTDPTLITKYALDQNVGYGSKRHMDGIRAYGISLWHRRSFGICKLYTDPTTAPTLDIALRETLAQQDAALLASRMPKVKPPKEPKPPRAPRAPRVSRANKEAALLELGELLKGFISELEPLCQA